MTTKEKILAEIKDINYAYNNSSKYETIKNLLEELVEVVRCEDCGFAHKIDPDFELYECYVHGGDIRQGEYYCWNGIRRSS